MQFGANFPNPVFKDLDEDEGFKPSYPRQKTRDFTSGWIACLALTTK
jgi:hypothetical protein